MKNENSWDDQQNTKGQMSLHKMGWIKLFIVHLLCIHESFYGRCADKIRKKRENFLGKITPFFLRM